MLRKAESDKLREVKARAKKAAEEKAANRKVRGEVGDYGFGINTMKHKFCLSITKKAKTMTELCVEKWNPKGRTHYGFFNELKSSKIANRTKEGKLFIVGSPADPNKKVSRKKKAA